MKTKSMVRDNRGSALVIAMVVTVVVAGMAGAFISISLTQNRSTQTSESRETALSLAEAGLDFVVFRMTNWATNSTSLVENTDVAMAGGSYRFDVTPNFSGVQGQYAVVSTGTFGGTRRRIESVVAPIVTQLFTGAAFGKSTITMDSNAMTDGYNSSLGTYASQVASGHGHNTGTIGSDGNITLLSATKVWGNATPGPGKTVSGAGGRVSGSTTPASAPRSLPVVTLPPAAAALPGTSWSKSSGGPYTFAAGTYHFSQFTADSNVIVNINGPATIIVDSFALLSNARINVNSTGGPVQIYGTGKFVMDSNTVFSSTTLKPADIEIKLTTNNQSGSPEVRFDSNSAMYGTVYAPNANINLNSNGQLFGAVIANSLFVGSNYQVHYDEALAGGAAGPYRARNWVETIPN